MVRVGVVGLGPMGGAIFERLVKHRYSTCGFDLSSEIRGRYSGCGLGVRASLEALLAETNLVILALPDAVAVSRVCLRDGGVRDRFESGGTIVDTSTTDPACAREVREILADRGIAYLEAPVSGGRSGAESGQLTMLLHAEEEAVEPVREILALLTQSIVRFDAPGAAQAAKLLNNLMVATHLVALSEAIRLGESWELDAETLIGALNVSSGRSAVSEVNYPKWILSEAFDSGFSMRLMRKDVAAAMRHLESLDSGSNRNQVLRAVGQAWANSGSLSDDEDFNRVTMLVPRVESLP